MFIVITFYGSIKRLKKTELICVYKFNVGCGPMHSFMAGYNPYDMFILQIDYSIDLTTL